MFALGASELIEDRDGKELLAMTMRTHLEFRSGAFPAYPGEDEEVNPGIYGKRLAEFLATELPRRGFPVTTMYPEDWGWTIELENEEFALWIGCANYGDGGFVCFIEPSQPQVRKWLKTIPTTEIVDRLATALEQIMRESGKASNLRWWDEEESGRI
jgi:hypothetical protein